MQAFVARSFLTPVRDEEAESQRKAKSRHARQTRRSTQGVTLTDLKEAQQTISLSPQDSRQTEDALIDRSSLRKGFTDERRVKLGPKESTETTEISARWRKLDEQGNIEPRLETLVENPTANDFYLSDAGSCGLNACNTSFRGAERWWRDENQNPVEDSAQMSFATRQQQRRRCRDGEASDFNPAEPGDGLSDCFRMYSASQLSLRWLREFNTLQIKKLSAIYICMCFLHLHTCQLGLAPAPPANV
ncbi:unnamed protein product [Pleuronectes platessa]|uniref:Uncharacterized protein n=1 Tax=Pleuronectes platessa TaxID=8262 RepID=A0A9N7UPD4_PLEPL|nr:unnamed protein product [Pleuronectes platessa]